MQNFGGGMFVFKDMNKKADIQKIWRECFPGDTAQWRRMFFDSAYSDDEALVLVDPETDTAVSSLLLLPYSMTFQGSVQGLAYVYGAGTLRKFRARGYMSRLMRRALREAYERGDTFAALIPAGNTLRRYYSRFGFSTVFYRRPERYTSIHRFDYQGKYADVDPTDPKLFEAFERMMGSRPCCVQHTRGQFLTLMEDVRLSGYGFAAVADADSQRIAAMVWAAPEMASTTLGVRELLSESPDAAMAALAALKRQMPDRPLTLLYPPADSYIGGGGLIPGGMLRIINAREALGAVARNNPRSRLAIRLTDKLLPENDGVYRIEHGELAVGNFPGPYDLDLTAEVLASMLFSSRPIAEVTGLPAQRPQMSLMLD